MSEGWVCPVCKHGVAPDVKKCPCRGGFADIPWKPGPVPTPPYTVGDDPAMTWPTVRYVIPVQFDRTCRPDPEYWMTANQTSNE